MCVGRAQKSKININEFWRRKNFNLLLGETNIFKFVEKLDPPHYANVFFLEFVNILTFSKFHCMASFITFECHSYLFHAILCR